MRKGKQLKHFLCTGYLQCSVEAQDSISKLSQLLSLVSRPWRWPSLSTNSRTFHWNKTVMRKGTQLEHVLCTVKMFAVSGVAQDPILSLASRPWRWPSSSTNSRSFHEQDTVGMEIFHQFGTSSFESAINSLHSKVLFL